MGDGMKAVNTQERAWRRSLPVVLLPTHPVPRSWEQLRTHLREAGLRVPDPAVQAGRAADAQVFLADIPPDVPFHVVAHGWGAASFEAWAAAHPDRWRAVVEGGGRAVLLASTSGDGATAGGEASRRPGVFRIAGYAWVTQVAPLDRETPDPASEPGDGLVPLGTAAGDGRTTWYTAARHQDMPADAEVRRAVADLLLRDATEALPAGWARTPGRAFARTGEDGVFRDPAARVGPGVRATEGRSEQPGAVRSLRVSVRCGEAAPGTGFFLLGVWRCAVQGSVTLAEGVPLRVTESFHSAISAFQADPDSWTRTEPSVDDAGLLFAPIEVGAGGVRTAVRVAVERAVEFLQAHVEAGEDLHLCTTLLGVYEAHLPVEDSVSAVVEGVVRANRRGPPVRSLELREVWEDVAVEAALAVARLGTLLREPLGWHEHVLPAPRMIESDRPWALADREVLASLPWRRLGVRTGWRVRSEPGGRRAEEETVYHWSTQTSADQVVRTRFRERDYRRLFTAMHDPKDIPEKERIALLDQLVPKQVADLLGREDDVLLVVDPVTAGAPWEALFIAEGSTRAVPAREMGFVRHLALECVAPITEGRDHLAVVFTVSDGAVALKAARREGSEIEAFYRRAGYEVERVEEPDPDAIRTALLRHPRVFHLAAHGTDPGDGSAAFQVPLPGLRWIEPAFFASLPVLPSLLFFNCCNVGRVLPDNPATFVQTLVSRGARAVVASPSRIIDEQARHFALTFHEALLQGRPFGRALQVARAVVHAQGGGDNRWSWWQGWGDPDFHFVRPEIPPVACLDVISRIRAEDVKSRRGQPLEVVRRRLAGLEAVVSIQPSFQQARVWEALGDAWAVVGEKDRSVGCYERALMDSEGLVSVRTAEQLLNLLDRRIADMARAAPSGEHAALLRRHEAVLDRLDGLLRAAGPSLERASLLAGCHKRLAESRARITPPVDPEEVMADLASSATWYRRAWRLGEQREEAIFYPALNALQVQWVAGSAPVDLGSQVRDLATRAEEAVAGSADPWARVYPVDARAFLWVLGQDEGSLEQAVRAYRDLSTVLHSKTRWDSIRKQYVWMVSMLRYLGRVAEAGRVATLLARVDAACRVTANATSGA